MRIDDDRGRPADAAQTGSGSTEADPVALPLDNPQAETTAELLAAKRKKDGAAERRHAAVDLYFDL